MFGYTTGLVQAHPFVLTMQPTPEQRKQIEETLLAGFDEGELARLLSLEMDVALDHVAGGDNLAETVHALVGWAQRHGRLRELIDAAYRMNPQNDKVSALATASATWPDATETPSPARAQSSSMPTAESETVPLGMENTDETPPAIDEGITEPDRRQPWPRYGIWFFAGLLIAFVLLYVARNAIGCFYQGIGDESQGRIGLLLALVTLITFLLGALGLIRWLQRGRGQEWLSLLLGFVVLVALFMVVNVGDATVGYDETICRSTPAPTPTPTPAPLPTATETPTPVCADDRHCVLVAAFEPPDDAQAQEISSKVLDELDSGHLLDVDEFSVQPVDALANAEAVQRLAEQENAQIIVWGQVYRKLLGELTVHFELANQLGIDQSSQLRPYRVQYFGDTAPQLSCAGDCFDPDNLGQAINQLGEIIAHMAAGMVHYSLGRVEEARHDLDVALYCIGETDGTDTDGAAMLNLANVDCDPNLNLDSFNTGSLYYYAGRAKLLTGDYAAALALLQKAADQNPDDPAPHIAMAEVYERWLNNTDSSDFKTSLDEAKTRALALRAESVSRNALDAEIAAADYELGFIAELARDWDTAADQYQAAVDGLGADSPDSYVAQIALGRVLGQDGQTEAAEEVLEAAHALSIEVPWALLEQARLHGTDRALAEPLLEEARRIAPNQPYVDIVAAQLCGEWADYDCAAAAYERALSLRPNSGWLYDQIGGFYAPNDEATPQQNAEKAVEYFAEAVKRRPNDPWTQERLAFAEYANGDVAAAAVHFAASLELSHRQSQIAARYCTLGQAQQAAGQYEQALESYQTCLDKDVDPALIPTVETLMEEVEAAIDGG